MLKQVPTISLLRYVTLVLSLTHAAFMWLKFHSHLHLNYKKVIFIKVIFFLLKTFGLFLRKLAFGWRKK